MHIKKTAAVTLSVCALTLGTALGAEATTGNTFSSTLTPTSVHVGQTFKITGTHAKPSTTYYCVEIVVKGTGYAYSPSSLKTVKSSSTGHVVCKGAYKAFKATVNGTTQHCPQTRADRRAHVMCGIGVSTADQKSKTSAFFTSVTS